MSRAALPRRRTVYTGFKSAPFREVASDEPAVDVYQQLVNRVEERGGRGQVPPKAPPKIEAAPLLADRRCEREQFADTTPVIVQNDDDDQWVAPGQANCVTLTACVVSGLVAIAGLSWAIFKMAGG